MSKKIVAKVFNYARAEGASGLVITMPSDRVALHYHFADGPGRELSLPKSAEAGLLAGLRQILGLTEGELLSRKYYKVSDPGLRIDFYLSVLAGTAGDKIVIDIVRRPQPAWRLSRLGLQRQEKRELTSALEKGSGLIVITARNGGGKSATLQAMLSHLEKTEKDICRLDRGAAPGPSGWERALRHDCDVIVAEDGDDETLIQALRAASTGRLVLLTIKAADALEVLTRILNLDLPLRFKLDALRLIVGQNLVPLKKIRRAPSRRASDGERSEIGIFEILRLSPEIKKFILAAPATDLTAPKFLAKLKKQIAAEGFRTIAEDRRLKTRAGLL